MIKYTVPAEWEKHEATWLSWPHNKSKNHTALNYRDVLDPIWIAMTKAIHTGENVEILVTDMEEQDHVEGLLKAETDIDMTKVHLHIVPNNDVWIRDMGPIFVRDDEGKVLISNWGFNGWGDKYRYELDNKVPAAIQKITGMKMVDVPLILEGGGIEINGCGDFMAAETSIVNDNRNPGKSRSEIETIITKYLGTDNFIWIDGINGSDNHDEDTDFHIDGAARFVSKNTIICEYDPFDDEDELLHNLYEKHMRQIKIRTNKEGNLYNVIPIPVTRECVKAAGCRGSYLNYYVCNDAVIIPVYNDINDNLAIQVISGFFPGRKAVPIDVSELFPYGGMIHCVTKQQPVAL